ncbi:hypothetical protein OMAG_000281, partial [Candidatus Omnitrophus magneticus]
VYSYKIIKKICSNGSYSLPVEFEKDGELVYVGVLLFFTEA